MKEKLSNVKSLIDEGKLEEAKALIDEIIASIPETLEGEDGIDPPLPGEGSNGKPNK
jgi:hypothetical protein|uniref:hypothetical protein n=1 Tax=Phocaeicola coprocola TaxID=310298 RepID=UPI003FEE1722